MYNLLDKIKSNPAFYKQLSLNEQLVTEFNCPLDTPKEKIWSDESYIVYVVDGKKIWHLPGRAYELTSGKCIFVKKGAQIVEQFFDATFCAVFFFLTDEFIRETIRPMQIINQNPHSPENISPISVIQTDDSLHAFYNSVAPYFLNNADAKKELLELKFKELILNVVGNPGNKEVRNYFCSLLTDSNAESMRKIMEENFHSNLGIEQFARLCSRSLSAFKRDFELLFKTTPGRWLLDRRLDHARLLISTSSMSVGEIAYECGFENPSHFSRVFKTRFGNAPASYRQAIA